MPYSKLDLSRIHSKTELMTTLGTFFSLPDWWWHNWDAFSDCLQVQNVSTLPSHIQILWFEHLQKNLSEDARNFREILDENGIEYTLLPS